MDIEDKILRALSRAVCEKWRTMDSGRVASIIYEDTDYCHSEDDVNECVKNRDKTVFSWGSVSQFINAFDISVRVQITTKKKLKS